jgi:hypothetical protein
MTALMYASYRGHMTTAQALIGAGADLDLQHEVSGGLMLVVFAAGLLVGVDLVNGGLIKESSVCGVWCSQRAEQPCSVCSVSCWLLRVRRRMVFRSIIVYSSLQVFTECFVHGVKCGLICASAYNSCANFNVFIRMAGRLSCGHPWRVTRP